MSNLYNQSCRAQPSIKYPNKQVLLIRGFGCKYFANCFECPYPDCKAPDKPTPKTANVYVYTDGLRYSTEPI